MAEYTSDDLTIAEDVIQSFWDRDRSSERDRQVNRERKRRGLDENIPTLDIETDSHRFKQTISFANEYGVSIPCLRVENESIPYHLDFFSGDFLGLPFRRGWGSPEAYYYYRDGVKDIIDSSGSEYKSSPEEAQTTFRRLAARFLAFRIAGIREMDTKPPGSGGTSFLNIIRRPGGPRVMTPGCTFTVITNTAGLRVLWSPGYAIAGNFFSAPTSPVSSTLQAGTYVFGVDGGAYGNTPQWDHALVTLPGNPSVHLNF